MTNIWHNCLPSYLLLLNNLYNKEHYLFVEGPSDRDFFAKLFSDKTYIDLQIDKNHIKNAFPSDFKEHFQNIYGKPLKREDEDNHYLFVIEAIKTSLVNNDLLPNLECYGFIDRDFNQADHSLVQDGVDMRSNLSITEMHDFETTIIRYCLPIYLQYIDENKIDNAIQDIKKAIHKSIHQGIAQECSINSGTGDFYHLTNWQNYNDIKFIGKKYRGIENTNFVNSTISKIQKFYRDNYSSVEKVNSVIDKWLNNERLNRNENKLLDNIFLKINGHYFLTNLFNINFDVKINGGLIKVSRTITKRKGMSDKEKDKCYDNRQNNEKSFMNVFVNENIRKDKKMLIFEKMELTNDLFRHRPFYPYKVFRDEI